MESRTARYTDSLRMALRSRVKLAGELIAPCWPMRTFVHHNVLHGLEHRPFAEAVAHAERLLGARGYPLNEWGRHYYRLGRIRPLDVAAALRTLAEDGEVRVAGRSLSHLDVLTAQFLQGVSPPGADVLSAAIERAPERPVLEALIERLQPLLPGPNLESQIRASVEEDLAALGRAMSLSQWCDRVLSTEVVPRIDGELTKWAAAFLDEGQAAWPMPGRDASLYGTWRALGRLDKTGPLWRLRAWRQNLDTLAEHPEDAVLDALGAMEIPEDLWGEYFTLHLVALPGWVGFMKWRAEQQGYAWQEAYQVTLMAYLAIRLFYEQELVRQACREGLGLDATFTSIRHYMHWHPLGYVIRRQRVAGQLPAALARQVDRLQRRGGDLNAWDALGEWSCQMTAAQLPQALARSAAWRLVALSRACGIDPAAWLECSAEELATTARWLEAFPETAHGPIWLEALERGYHDQLLGQLQRQRRRLSRAADALVVRPQAQAVFCLDVRSEIFRRHLERSGDYETFGFAGFFVCFIRYRAFGAHHETDQYPVIMKARNVVREIPRAYHGEAVSRYRARARMWRAIVGLLHDLKEHVITPYVMVESVGWFFSAPFIGKTIMPRAYRRASEWLTRLFAPPVSTTLTVDKLSKAEAEEMVAAEQRAQIRRALRERLGIDGPRVASEVVESLRLRALDDHDSSDVRRSPLGRLPLSAEEETAFIDHLRQHYRIDPRWEAAWKDRITRTGFTLEEQVFTVETALRMMGLVQNFARLVLLCAHGSTSDNNPFEAALDCGACGGNAGKPNARLLAAMANKPSVRERLAKNGLQIPDDTHFVAGQIDTTTDQIEVLDLEDAPPTHRKDLSRLREDLKQAAVSMSHERARTFPDVDTIRSPMQAHRHVLARAADWSQVRPEWGLSGNAALIIAPRALTYGMDLGGRVFMHSYDYRQDPSGKLLEVLLTGPQTVAQWINLEHYFSTVDNERYGSGSKVYHNVVGRVGVMVGTQSDLRSGLARQTVMVGDQPYHEPVRLLTIVEAPRDRITTVIRRHELLQRFYHNRWVHLVALDDGTFHRYVPDRGWLPILDAGESGR